MQGLAEFVFASTLWAHDPELKIRWMDHQADRYLEGTLLMERYTFRLASATFAWSPSDLAAPKRPSRPPSRLRHQQVSLKDSCLRRHHGHRSLGNRPNRLLPPCVLVFHPIDSPMLMRDLARIVSETHCLPSQQASRQAVRSNQRLLSKLIAFEPKRDLVPSRGSNAWKITKMQNMQRILENMSFSMLLDAFFNALCFKNSVILSFYEPVFGRIKPAGQWPCPKLRFKPRLRPMWETFQQPKALHHDEWAPGLRESHVEHENHDEIMRRSLRIEVKRHKQGTKSSMQKLSADKIS